MNQDFWLSIVKPVSQGGVLGAPFVWGGRGPDSYDCWGLVVEVYRRMGRPILDVWQDQRESPLEVCKIMEEESRLARWTKTDPANYGDVIALSANKLIHHVGVFTPWGILHIAKGAGVLLQDKQALKLSNYKILGSYTYHG